MTVAIDIDHHRNRWLSFSRVGREFTDIKVRFHTLIISAMFVISRTGATAGRRELNDLEQNGIRLTLDTTSFLNASIVYEHCIYQV